MHTSKEVNELTQIKPLSFLHGLFAPKRVNLLVFWGLNDHTGAVELRIPISCLKEMETPSVAKRYG